MMKIYKKRGNKNYKERKMLAELEPILAKKLEQNPDFSLVTATNMTELKTLYNKHVPTEVTHEDVQYIGEKDENETDIDNENKINSNIDQEKEITDNMNKDKDDKTDNDSETIDNNPFVDPLNRQEPIVRDYVYGDQSLKDEKKPSNFGQTNFAEPVDFEEAFVIPDDDEDDTKGDSKTKDKSSSTSEATKQKTTSSDPLNPDWDEMKGSVQKKKTRKFAKYIVEAVSTLQQKGFVYYANKDINEAKLSEYELEGIMDLTLLVTLEDGQEVTVKQFFQNQCQKAEDMSHLTMEQKDDLAESLAEVLMEKGAGPTPTQELLLVTLTILGGQALTLMTLKSQTNSLLTQLRTMNSDEENSDDYEEPWHQQKTEMSEPEPKSKSKPKSEPEKQKKSSKEKKKDEPPVIETKKLLEIGETIETKE